MKAILFVLMGFVISFRSATGGADSGPASLEGTPTDDKDGQQAFGGGKFNYYTLI